VIRTLIISNSKKSIFILDKRFILQNEYIQKYTCPGEVACRSRIHPGGAICRSREAGILQAFPDNIKYRKKQIFPLLFAHPIVDLIKKMPLQTSQSGYYSRQTKQYMLS